MKEPGKLRIAIGNVMGVTIDQGFYDVAKRLKECKMVEIVLPRARG